MRLCAKLRYRRSRARVTATYIRRRSSSPSPFGDAVLVREQALLQPGQEDHVELQALGRMHGHQLHRVRAPGRFWCRRLQRGVGEEIRQ